MLALLQMSHLLIFKRDTTINVAFHFFKKEHFQKNIIEKKICMYSNLKKCVYIVLRFTDFSEFFMESNDDKADWIL